MKVAVAGGSGFVGRHVVVALRARGHTVVILSRGLHAPAPDADAEHVRCDLGAEPPPVDALRGCPAIVNLVGIKRESGAQTFERAHVAATEHLIATARAAGIRRFVHLSVVASRPDGASPYHDTKWRAEELLRASGLDWTILRPSAIHGRGDDFTTHLVKMVRFAPVFPVVGHGDSLLQPVAVEAVATAVAAALERGPTVGQSYPLVGPRAMTLREVVGTVAAGLELPLWIVSTPIWLQRVAVEMMNALTPQPLATPAQLQMLVEGLTGDPAPARAALGVESPPFSAVRVRELAAGIPPLCGISLCPGR
jgi:NADH dehydrogenase